ncbi:phage tail tape measure protein [Chryseobacterium mulctrae]|uniref:phage tail tape measure protein n=1 Tax=Chryseobacterium mulctrae TaxID=2576777 RepID=UPI001117575F|nr:phage tail tape measure protein [Chryseobacterium mulctrae]
MIKKIMSTATTTWVLNLSENLIPKFKTVGNEGEKAAEKIDQNFDKAGKEIDQTRKKTEKLKTSLKDMSSMNWNALSEGFERISGRLSSMKGPGADFDESMHELKALTGVTDEQMAKMTKSGREMALEFGGNGARQLSSYQNILGALGPEIAENDAALAKMGRNVNIMSKSMKGDVSGATNALNNAMIQFKVSLEDPMQAAEEMDKMMNVMVASARAGSVEVPQISDALSEVGGVAKMSNLTFEETNALLQGMAKGGVEVGKLGVASRNALLKMAAPVTLSDDASEYLKAYGVDLKKVSDTTIPFAERLRELQKVGHDMNALALIFGTENVQGAQAMLSTINYQEELTAKVTGTKDAYTMAAENMESWKEKMSRYSAQIDDWKTSIFDAISPVITLTEASGEMLATGSDLANIYSGMAGPMSNFVRWIRSGAAAQKLSSIWTGISTFVTNAYTASINVGPLKAFTMWVRNSALAQKLSATWTGIVTAAQWAWNAALTANPIGLIVVGIAALVALVAAAIVYWDDWGATLLIFMGPVGRIIAAFKSIYDHWDSIKKAFQTDGILGGLKRIGVVLLDVLLKPLQQISGWIDKIFNTDLEAGIKKLRTEMDLVTENEKKSEADEKAKTKGEKVVPKQKQLTEKERIDKAIKEGKLVMYMGKAVLPSTRDKAEV